MATIDIQRILNDGFWDWYYARPPGTTKKMYDNGYQPINTNVGEPLPPPNQSEDDGLPKFPIDPSDEQLVNYYSRHIVEYMDKHGYTEENRYSAMAYALKEILKRWGDW